MRRGGALWDGRTETVAKRRPFASWTSRTLLGSFLLSLGAACGTTTITGSGNLVTKPVPVSSFSKIQIADAFDVNVTLGRPVHVTVGVDGNLVNHLDVGVSNGTLHLGLKPGTSVQNATLKADVTAPTLSDIEVSGAGQMHLLGDLSGQNLDVLASGSGGIVGSVRVNEADLNLSGASHATLSGSAGRFVVRELGASHLEADGLQARVLTATLSGASSASVWVTDAISAELSGASSLRYRGSPRFIRRQVSGGSSVTPL